MSILLISTPSFTPPLINMSLKTVPQVHTESKILTIRIENMTIEAVQLKTITIFSNGTKIINISISIEKIPGLIGIPSKPILRVNATKVIPLQETVDSEDKTKNFSVKSVLRNQEPKIQTVLDPVPPPNATEPPLDQSDWYWEDTIVLFLKPGVKYPTNGDPPFYIRYSQPDNWYNYWPRDWWTPWCFMVANIYEHISKVWIEDFIDGTEDWTHFMTRNLDLAGAGLTLGGSIVTFIGATLTGAGITLGWVPPLALVLAAAGLVINVISTIIEDQGYQKVDFIQDKVMTDPGDGFVFFKIQEGFNYFWTKIPTGVKWPPNQRPSSIIYHHGERNYLVAFGSDFQSDTWTHISTEWYYQLLTHDEIPLPSLIERWHGGWIVGP